MATTLLVGMAPFENEGIGSWREEKKRLDDSKGEKDKIKKIKKIVVDILRDQAHRPVVLHKDPNHSQPPAATIVPCVHLKGSECYVFS